jgi:adenosyl cobinamide kinase/adenosyl cobinamide phosphate guanylyltransferase
MALTLLTGGARSGKSNLAQQLASAVADDVTFVATATRSDADMSARIDRHRAARPGHWATVEAPLKLEPALEEIGSEAVVIVDCLTLWVSNLMLEGFRDDEIEERAAKAAAIASARSGYTFVVTNEVGSGVHPDTELGLRFRDVLGRVNATWSQVSDSVYLVIAGRVLELELPPEV